MTWAVLDADGYIAATYQREESARLNAGGRRIVETSLAQGEASARWHWDGEALVFDGGRRLPGRAEDVTYAARRRKAYGQEIETDLQFEALLDAVNALVAAHRSGAPAPPNAFDKLDAINLQIAAVKKAHPRD